MKILVKNNKERVKNQEVEMKKVQKLLRRSLATGLALVMTVSSMTIVPDRGRSMRQKNRGR